MQNKYFFIVFELDLFKYVGDLDGRKSFMDEIEKKYFDKLNKNRTKIVDVLDSPCTSQVWGGIVEKYSDQAHFIYELIQNADDAGAISARFILEPDRLIFAHNGKRHFSISDLDSEGPDSKEGRLGDINAITGIAFSNKKTQEHKIGKFGVGFKAVFQYTQTPHIYDPKFRFKLDRYIVPIALDEDFSGRGIGETLFVFPFDRNDKKPEETYKDIESKLKDLSYPVLFLTNLSKIDFEISDYKGSYNKEIKDKIELEGTTAEKICLIQNNGAISIDKELWLFSRLENGLKYSVGFFLDENACLVASNEPAFCFFPTKETTGLNFLIHAPFLLTDSREGIRVGIEHNTNLINKLAKLSADSIVYLRDIGNKYSVKLINDDIFSIIPTNEKSFSELGNTSRISFKPFYNEIKKVFKSEELIPTRNGYTRSENAYLASVQTLTQVFSDSQLADLCDNKEAQWAFVSMGRDELQRSNKDLLNYIESITNDWINEEHIIKKRSSYSKKGIDENFIEKQPIEWLHSFYKWLSDTSRRTELAKCVPVFLDKDSKATAAFNEQNRKNLFLPAPGDTDCRTINESLLENEETKSFVEKIGITEPSTRDYIYNDILPQYKNDGRLNTDSHFQLFFEYYKKCSQSEVNDFINEIKNLAFIKCSSKDDPNLHRGAANRLYLPTYDLVKYFESKPSTLFVELEYYKKLVGESDEIHLTLFLNRLGVKSSVLIYEYDINIGYKYTDILIDGCEEILNFIKENKSEEKSKTLWQQLLSIVLNNYTYRDTKNLVNGRFQFGGISNLLKGRYVKANNHIERSSSAENLLKTSEWLLNNDGEFVSAEMVSISTLSEIYDTTSDASAELLAFLGISEYSKYETSQEDDSNLSDKQKESIGVAKRCAELGLTLEDLEEMARIKQSRISGKTTSKTHSSDNSLNNTVFDDYFGDDIEYDVDENGNKKKIINKDKKKIYEVTKDIIKRTKRDQNTNYGSHVNDADENYDFDADEYSPSTVDFGRKAELEKQKAARAIDKIAYQEELQKRALDSEKYSYGWFKAILGLETLNSTANNINSKEVSITFGSIEREVGTTRTLILKQPNRYIPQFMEDLSDIPLVIRMGDQTKNLAIEVASVKSYTLRVKLKADADIDNIDFSKVTEARIDARSPVFLIENLKKVFAELGYDDSYNMQKNLCENIEFVFGPPGTGKTTHLAENVILPIMANEPDAKILVLTPTNKAADVLVRRIMSSSDKDKSYEEWLIRFGGTGDEVIEQSPVYRDKTFDIREVTKNVTVTTIARFPYDFFMPQGARIFLNGINWDYIIIDEASMIPLVNIIYPLYKKTPKKFIIAGDPFQIEPITSVDLWKNENIYTMVNLKSFVNHKTTPYDYKVELLKTQYRSIPSIGSIFSNLTYDGILEHYRTENSRKNLNIDDKLKLDALNIIKFPVSKYESIYRSKRLQQSSSYQIYSALFIFEFVSYLSKLIANANSGELFKIGIIAPYRAQADLIEKLISSAEIPKEIDIQVGTIHGFQGDECDIIFAVFNTPPSITSNKEMFLNKNNIINVSLSRAKDYLFVVMPDDNTENINNLFLVKRVEELFKTTDSYVEFQANDLEKHIFNNANYLEENSFSTSHQNVNVYGLPEKRYEIRCEDTAIDVQIHRLEK